MSDPLTLARLAPLSPYVPATEAMLEGWCGPVRLATDSVDYALLRSAHDAPGWYLAAFCTEPSCTLYAHYDNVRLDTRRPEVRDRLTRLGILLPTFRDHPGAAVAAGMGVGVRPHIWPVWLYTSDGCAFRWGNAALRQYHAVVPGIGWRGKETGGPETGDAGRLAADLAALRLGCVLEEPDGWYIPLPGGGVGFVAKESPNAV